MAEPEDSLFTYSGSLDYNKFHDQRPNIHKWMQFVPWYAWDEPNFKFPTRLPFSESDMFAICDGDEQCLYDTKAMGSLEIGEATRNAHRYYKFLNEAMKPSRLLKTVNFPLNTRKSYFYLDFKLTRVAYWPSKEV